MKKLRWQILIVIMALIAIGVILIGQQPTSLLPIAPEVKPATGGVYTEGLVGSLERLNPLLDYYHPSDHDVDRLLYSGLLRFDGRGLPQLDLAESMGISKDGKIYNFSLRANVLWHDGKSLTSADVVFTIEQMRKDGIPVPDDIRSLWNTVQVQALDDLSIQFRLPEAYAPFLDYLTFGILPRHLLSELNPEQLINAPFNLNPVGSGPYRLERVITEDKVITGLLLAKFKDYYVTPPFIEQIVFRYYPDSRSAYTAYQAGEVQGISQITSDVLTDVLKEPDLSLYTGRMPQLSLVFLNLKNTDVPFFQDASIRRALLMGLNRQKMIDQMMGGQAIIADGPIFPGSWAYYEGIERINYNPEAALTAIKTAGYSIPGTGGDVRAKDGQLLQFELLYPLDPQHAVLAEAIAADWKRLGVGVVLKPVPYAELISNYLEPRSYQAVLVDIDMARYPDPDPYPFWHQAQITGGQNYSQWDDRQASEYLEQARIIGDLVERTRLYRNFQVRFTTEMPALPLFYPVYTFAVDKGVQGVTMGPLFDTSDRFATISRWFLVATRTGEGTPTSPAVNPTSPP
jgi:peptide/nickel transport system substrate-binding protein